MTQPVYYCLDLKEDPQLITGYRKWHAAGAVPPAVVKSIRSAGIAALDIFLAGNRLVMVLVPGANFDEAKKAEADATDPEVQAWEELMWTFQQALPFAAPGQKWIRMEPIFSLDDQP